VQLERGAHHDDRAPGIVNALAEQVLAEPALLALDHVRQRLQGAPVGTGDRTAPPAIVQQGVHCLLQHALFVTHDDIGRIQLQEPPQAIVAVDDPTIQVIQIRRCKASTIQRHQRPEIWRQNRENGHYHPLGMIARIQESLDQLEPLGKPLDLGLRTGAGDRVPHLDDLTGEIDRLQHLVDGLSAHAGIKLIAVLLNRLKILLIGEQLAALQRGHSRVDDDECFEIEHPLDLPQRHVKHEPDPGGQRFKEPYMSDRTGEFDVPHALAANLGLRYLNAAFLANDAPMLQALVFAAKALVVLDGPEDLGAEQAITLGLEGAVVDRLRLLDLTKRPRADHFGRCQGDPDRVEFLDRLLLLEKLQ